MSCVYIGVGSNLGDRLKNIRQAKELVNRKSDIKIISSSDIYETDPVGGPSHQNKYLNAVWRLETVLSAQDLLKELLEVEQSLGRLRAERNSPRTLDLDILFYDDQVQETKNLILPHPRIHERYFVLKPLAELAPNFVHPGTQKTVSEMLEAVS